MECCFTIYDHIGQPVAWFSTATPGPEDSSELADYQFVCELPELTLQPGMYRINAALMTGPDMQDHVEGAAVFEVAQGQVRGRPATSSEGYGSVCIAHRWSKPAR
jgi:lipopolysaccharide transport system ATP-binding protein